MKAKAYLTACLFIVLSACSKDAVNGIISNTGVNYKQSLSKWQIFKQSVNNNYSYTVTTQSWEANFRTETKLTIQNGVVTGRDYTFYKPAGAPGTITNSWSEKAATLNSHGNYEGAETLTMDEVYTKAANVWLVADKSKNAIYFETDSKGLLSSCGYVPNGCQDDCFFGISIKEIVGL